MAETQTASRRIAPATIVLVLAALLAIAAVVYSLTRSGEPIAADPAAAPAAQAAADPAAAIAAMRQGLAQDPDNHRAWHMLGLTLQRIGRFDEARDSYQRAMQLQPENPDYLSSYAEMLLVLGGDGADREAEAIFRRALEFRRDHPAPRYYLAVLKDQKGQHREAVDELIALLNEAPAGASWEAQVRDAAEKIARANNIDIAGRLPAPRQSVATAAIPGPTQQQMEAARGIPPSQQDDMAKQMVDRLAARLAQNPRDERGWIMLMRSRMVRGEQAGAAEALRSALATFADDAAVQQRLRTAAAELGIPAG
jgi:cytochrome c-type biogenesis protein CcmH